ncbi:serine/threonine-protein kinase [Massilia oculi]|uniref:serine/threonine-protein kinase n=2 Tax=Pseudomonadota TaxID=1224 RepID=UPI001AB00004|nr:serine/threonine-protein kinase [Massilia oculi]
MPTEAPPANSPLPSHYELGAHLGAGGYGEVYEAWDNKLQRRVAIKRIERAAHAGGHADPLHEARMAASLHHPSFVTVYAIEEDASGASIVMELVHGRTIGQLAQKSPIARATALDWIGQTAAAMQDAHAAGLVHGDLKPSNLMIEPSGKVRILDFGLASRCDALATGAVESTGPIGTIAYMAPERLTGHRADALCDIYAVGVLLYELLAGSRPHSHLSGLALAAAHMQSSSASWHYPDTIDAPLVALIRDMTAQQPAQRLPSMAQVVQRLGEIAHLQAPHPHPPPSPSPRRRWQGSVSVLVAVVLAGGAWRLAPAPVHSAAPAPVHSAAPAPVHPPAPVPVHSPAHEMQRGLAALKNFDRPGNLDAAERHFSAVLARDGAHAAAVAGMALVQTLRYRGDTQDEVWLRKADASAQQAMKLNDQLALAHIALGWVQGSQKQYERAGQAFERALQLDPADFFAWYGKAQLLRHAGHDAQAFETLRLAQAGFPRERVFVDELGSLLYERGDLAGAEQAFRRSIALQPDAVTGYANLNAALLRQGRADEALRVLQQGLQVRPSATLYGNLGNALFLRGDYVGAAAAFEHAVSPLHGAPGEYLNWANLADTLLWIPGREAEARQAYGEARRLLAPILQRAPHDATLVSRMGLYAARSGDRDAGMQLSARATKLAPRSADVQFRAGLARELLGERELALASIASARRLGYPAAFIDAEPDLVALRRDLRYPRP